MQRAELVSDAVGQLSLYLQLSDRCELGDEAFRSACELAAEAVEEPGVAVVLLAVGRELPAQICFYEGVHREDEEAGIYPLEPGKAGEIVVDSRRHASFLCFQRRSSSLGTSPHPTGEPGRPLSL